MFVINKQGCTLTEEAPTHSLTNIHSKLAFQDLDLTKHLLDNLL